MEYIKTLEDIFLSYANPAIAEQQSSYMRNQFAYHGIKTPVRRQSTKILLTRENLPAKPELSDIIHELWARPQRDYQLFGLDLAGKFKKKLKRQDIELLEFMVLNKSWWDTVDFIASHLISSYFLLYPDEISEKIEAWLRSENIWLQRCALLFQLKWKKQMDTKLLEHCILHLNGTSEFFINKAIGWVLREYSKTDPMWVITFVDNHELSALSTREALRLIR